MEMRRRQFCLTVTAGVATTMIPGRPAEAKVRFGLGKVCIYTGLGGIVLGTAMAFVGGVVAAIGVFTGNPFVAGTGTACAQLGGIVIVCGFALATIGATVCLFKGAWRSTGRGAGDVAGTARGDEVAFTDPSLTVETDLSLTVEAELDVLSLQHLPAADPGTRDAAEAFNRMVDAHNHLKSDILGNRDLGGAVTALRQSMVDVGVEVSRLDTEGFRPSAADVADARRHLQTEGLAPTVKDNIGGCGFSEESVEEFRQRVLQEDVGGVVGKTIGELVAEATAAAPDPADLQDPGPLAPVPDPDFNR